MVYSTALTWFTPRAFIYNFTLQSFDVLSAVQPGERRQPLQPGIGRLLQLAFLKGMIIRRGCHKYTFVYNRLLGKEYLLEGGPCLRKRDYG